NQVSIQWEDGQNSLTKFTDWEIKASDSYEAVDISSTWNDNVVNTFLHTYLSPRAASTTLQIPLQGIGNWCYPLIQPEISNAGIKDREYIYLDKIPFRLGGDKNIAYTSQWDNFPDSIRLPLNGKAAHAYLLMAG